MQKSGIMTQKSRKQTDSLGKQSLIHRVGSIKK